MPCIASLPAGWNFGGVHITSKRSTLWLDSDEGGDRALVAMLRPRDQCEVSGHTQVPSDEVGTTRYEDPQSLRPTLRTSRHYLFEGGCVIYRLALTHGADPSLLFEADQAIAFQPREDIVEWVRAQAGLDLYGAGVPCPGGSDP